jgi:hypothetical protein
MKDFFLKHYASNASEKEKINELFMDHTLNSNNEYFNKFKSLHKALNNEDYTGISVELNMPFMYYNNFNIRNISNTFLAILFTLPLSVYLVFFLLNVHGIPINDDFYVLNEIFNLNLSMIFK